MWNIDWRENGPGTAGCSVVYSVRQGFLPEQNFRIFLFRWEGFTVVFTLTPARCLRRAYFAEVATKAESRFAQAGLPKRKREFLGLLAGT